MICRRKDQPLLHGREQQASGPVFPAGAETPPGTNPQKEERTAFHQPDEDKKTDKATRIEADLEPLDREGMLIFNEAEKDNPHMKD